MKKVILSSNALTFLIGVFVVLFISSCSNDDDSDSLPIIESVTITDPIFADSTFTQAAPGSMIVINGRNLSHASALFINGQSVNFNPNMNTDHSIIATIPTEEDGFELTVWNPELESEIKVVTKGGVATFQFKVLAPVPSIERIAGAYPRETGDILTVYGINFLDITRVYFDDVNPYPIKKLGEEIKSAGSEIDVTDFTLSHNRYFDEKTKAYVTDSEMKLKLPDLSYAKGFLVIETPQGNAVIDYAALPPTPVLKGISSDMPIPGSKVKMTGSYFINVTGIKIGDNIVVSGDNISVAENESELTFVMPEKPTETTSISVVTPGGESNSFVFYNYESLLINFDDLGFDEGWSPNADYRIATADAEPFISDGKFAVLDGENPAWNWWGTIVYWAGYENHSAFKLLGYDVIPADTSAEDIYLMFECYNKYPFTKVLHYQLQDINENSYEWVNYNYDTGVSIVPELVGVYGDPVYSNWYTVVLPMSRFNAFEGKTYADIVNTGLNRIRFMQHNYGGDPELVFLCIDNIRIGTLPLTISKN